MGKKVLLITENFPYLPGEQFLEGEVFFWDKYFKGNFVILPISANGHSRVLPVGIEVELGLAKKLSLYRNFFFLLKAFFSDIFLKELAYLLSVRKFKGQCVRTALKHTFDAFKLSYLLEDYLKEIKEKPLIYTYWFNTAYYAAALLKRKGLVGSLVSRAHGFDVYEDRRSNHYMPLKRQFIKELDQLSAVSEKGKFYLVNTYGIEEEKISVDKLGVKIPHNVSPPGDPMVLTILSVSYCVEVKNIHKIIEAIELCTRKKQEINFVWHHLGDGPLKPKLENLAEQKLTSPNVSWTFHGNLTNNEVIKFYENHQIDVFINTSKSEGVPVSIMEAMGYGIPAIGPDVGGVSEIINSNHGVLLPPDPTSSQISETLLLINFFKRDEVRRNAKEYIRIHYNAEENYGEFIDRISSI